MLADQPYIGQKGNEVEEITVTFDEPYGELYPLSLRQELGGIKDSHPEYPTL